MTHPGGFTLPTRPASPEVARFETELVGTFSPLGGNEPSPVVTTGGLQVFGWGLAANPSVSVETTRNPDGTYTHKVMPASTCEWCMSCQQSAERCDCVNPEHRTLPLSGEVVMEAVLGALAPICRPFTDRREVER